MQEVRTIVFMVTNGAGLGHLTRGLAVAKRLAKIDPSLNIVFLSTSLATEVIREAGFMYFYTPTRAILTESTTASDWNRYISRQLNEIIEIYHPIALVYDGVYPYLGVLSTLKNQMIKSIWIKRECYKEETKDLKHLEAAFDLVIVPKELASDQMVDTAKRKHCNPIIFLDKEEAHTREVVRKQIGLTEKENLFYLQLGAGTINSIDQLLQDLIQLILKQPENRILLGESIIGKHIEVKDPHIIHIRSYPNSQYFKGVDYAVSAAGYNTFHELLYFGIPTIFIPNTRTTKDDQVARVKMAESKNACIGIQEDQSNKEYAAAMDQLVTYKDSIKKNATKLIKENGAMQAAQYIYNFINGNL